MKLQANNFKGICGDMVYRLALTNLRSVSDAEDVFQVVFLRLVQHAPQFCGEEHEKTWLVRVTINCTRRTNYRAYE